MRFLLDWEIDRVGYEAFSVSYSMQFSGLRNFRVLRDRDFGSQDYSLEMTRSVISLLHETFSVIDVLNNHNSRDGAQVQIPELVTS